ncbi:MAG: 23S rRNA (guanosine(2251)-2'-O)-methyltransferase RlmB, partial [Pseudomonadota bacterium]
PRAQSREPDDFCALFGLHAVAAALANPARQHRQLFVTENAAQRLDLEAYTADLEIVSVTPRDLDRRLGTDTVHQGVLLETSHTPTASLPELISSSATGPIIVLDQVTDPHNVGAVLRSAAVFDARGVILTKRNSPPLSGVLAKAASGGLEATRVHLASNLARAIKSLQEAGVNVVGLASDADGQLQQVNTQRPTAFVLGAEGKGLRKLTAEACDQLVSIETGATITSLNVSNAAAIVLHWTSMQHAS